MGKGIPKPLTVLCLLSLLATLIYSNTFLASFHFDDINKIVENPMIKHLENFLDFSGTRYVGFLTFALNYRFGGLHLFGYHLINLLIHIANGFLVYSLVLILVKADNPLRNPPFIALAAALLFIAHPLQTQAVTYIVQRFASLMTLFYLLSVAGYLRWRLGSSGPGSRPFLWYGVSLLSCFLAMKTKENSFTLPLMILLVEWIFFRPLKEKRWRFLVPYLLMLPLIPLSRGDILGEAEGFARDVLGLSRPEYLFTQFRVIITYLRLLVLPINQNLDYDYPGYQSLFNPSVFVSFLFLSFLFGLAVYLLRRPREQPKLRLIAFGILWFFLTLSTESSIIPIRDLIFEHRVYLPSVGFFLLVSVVVAWGWERWKKNRVPLAGLVFLIVGSLSFVTYQRNRVWNDELTLWQDVVRKAPHKARGHNNLGSAYRKKGRLEEAIREYQTALRLQPNWADAHNNLGIAYSNRGSLEEAIREYQTALQLQPDHAKAHSNLGLVYKDQGRLEEAIREYQTALRLQPTLAEVHYNLGVAYQKKGMLEAARGELKEALRLKADLPPARRALDSLPH